LFYAPYARWSPIPDLRLFALSYVKYRAELYAIPNWVQLAGVPAPLVIGELVTDPAKTFGNFVGI